MTRVRIEQLTKRVGGSLHLEGIDACFEPGSFTVLLGATRSGKTSLLRQVAGLDTPSSGGVAFETQDGQPMERSRHKIAMVVQEFINYPSMTVFENIASPLRASTKLGKAEIETRVIAAARRFQLEPLLKRLPSDLSGGQQQRTALARAMIKEAAVVLLDEPLANLDYKLRDELREDIRSTFQGSESVVIYASTDPQEALGFGGQTAVLHEGRLLQQGPARMVYQAPCHVHVAAAVGDPPMNLWQAELADGWFVLSEQVRFACPEHLARLEPGPWCIGLHAHHMHLEASAVANCLISASVELAEVHGSQTALHLSHGSTQFMAQAQGLYELAPGDALDLFFDPAQAYAFDPQGELRCAPPAPKASRWH